MTVSYTHLDVYKRQEQLREYLAEVLPNFDRDRVHVGDIKKLISWYNTCLLYTSRCV